MIDVSKTRPVNEPGEPPLTRAKVWQGLVMKANNALPFVPAMTRCEVIERQSDQQFVREIEFRGESMRERITLEPQSRVTFERLSGSVLGTILNEIEEASDGTLSLRFSFHLTLAGVAPGSDEEANYARTMEADYLKAVDATLGAIRRVEREDAPLLASD